MKTNPKNRVIIHSIEELRPSQRKRLKKTSIGFGLLVVLIYGLLLLVIGAFPGHQDCWFVYNIDLALIGGGTFVAFVVGYNLGFYMQMTRFGVAFPTRHQFDFYQPFHQPHSSSDTRSYASSSASYHGSASINPSSGKPMVGSSGLDTSGNPYGTRSW